MQKKQKPGKKTKTGLDVASQDEAQLLVLEQEILSKKNYRQLIEVGKALKKQGSLGIEERLPRYYLLRALELFDKKMSVEGGMLLDNIALPLNEVADQAQYEKTLMLCLQAGKTEKALLFLDSVRDVEPKSGALLEILADFIVLDEGVEKGLPEGHPLVAEGGRILEAMRHFQSGSKVELSAALSQISLRSPFRYWKLLLKGLELFHRNADEESAEYLSRIPPESAASVPASVFLDLLGRKVQGENPLLGRAAIETAIRRALDPDQTKLVEGSARLVAAFLRGSLVDLISSAEALFQNEKLLTKRQSMLLSRFVWTALLSAGQGTLQKLLKGAPRLVAALPDDKQLHRARALQLEYEEELVEAGQNWAALAESFLREQSAWIGAEDLPKARALVFLRAARLMKEGYLNAKWGFRGLNPDEIVEVEACLEQAYSLYPGLSGIYDQAVEVFERKKPKLSKWYHRLHQAFPNNEEAIFAGIDVDLEAGAIVRAEKNLKLFLARQVPGERLSDKLVMALLTLARKQFQKRKYDAARKTFSILLEADGEDGATRLKCGCMEYALGFKELGNSLISEALQMIAPPEMGLLQLLIEMKRFGAPLAASKAYRKELLKRVKAGALVPAASTVALHFHYLTHYLYPGAYEEINIVLDMIRLLKEKPLSLADFYVIVEYLEILNPPQTLLLAQVLEKSSKAYPGDCFLAFLAFFHVVCKGQVRKLTPEEKKNLTKWSEGLRQGGSSKSAQRIHYFLNRCQQVEPMGGGLPSFNGPFDGFGEDFDAGFGEDFDGGFEMPPFLNKEEVQGMSDLIESMPKISDPDFDKVLDEVTRTLGLPKGNGLKEMLLEMKRIAELSAGKPGAKKAKSGKSSKKRTLELFDDF